MIFIDDLVDLKLTKKEKYYSLKLIEHVVRLKEKTI